MRLFRILLSSLAIIVPCMAQQNPNLANGLSPYSFYEGGNIDSVSVVNGGLALHTSVASYPQRGSLKVDYFLFVNSKNWSVALDQQPNGTSSYIWAPDHLTNSGVRIANSLQFGLRRERTITTGGVNTVTTLSPPLLITPDGSAHRLVGGGSSNAYESVDDTGFSVTLFPGTSGPTGTTDTALIIDRNGNHYSLTESGSVGSQQQYQNPQGLPKNQGKGQFTDFFQTISVTDVDGNSFSLPDALSTVDTLGRSLMPLVTNQGDVTKCQSPTAVTTAGIRSLPGFGGTTGTIEICNSNYSFQTAFGQSGVGEDAVPGSIPGINDFTPSMISSIVLPNNTAWSFTYDQYGELSSITLPTGGKISYTWQTIPLCASSGTVGKVSRAVHTRTVTGPGVTTGTWTYGFGAQQSDGTMHNLVTDPNGNDTVHIISPLGGQFDCSFYETQAISYNGSQSSNNVLKTVNTSYSFTAPASLGYSDDSEFALNVYPQTVTTTLPNGLVSQVVTTEAAAGSATGSPVLGAVVNRKEYDYGQGAPGSLIKQTSTSYAWQAGANAATYLAANILNTPVSAQVQDGSGNRCSETDYVYDEAQYLTATAFGSANHHGPPPASVRGHASTTNEWVGALSPSSASCQLLAGGSWSTLSRHTNWFDTGEIYQSIDANGNATTHSYDPAFWGAYQTQTTNALSQSVSGNYDFNTALVTSYKDSNTQTTSYSYDNMFRIVQAAFPDQGQTKYQYTDTPGSLGLQQTVLQSAPSTLITTNIAFDGMGRKLQSTLLDPEGADVTMLAYDAIGRLSKTYNPTRSFNASTPYTLTQYDALGRITSVTMQDGSIVTTSFTGNCTTVIDAAGIAKRSCSDAEGRLVEVDEPRNPPTPISATGTLTVNAINGSSLQVNNKPATGSVTIAGQEACQGTICASGGITISVNGYSVTTQYGQGSSTSSIASALADLLNGSGSPVTATTNGATVSISSVVTGAAGNSYALSTSYSFCGAQFNTCFSSSASGSTLTGGSTTYDYGTLTVSVGSWTSGSISYGQNGANGGNNTASLIASALNGILTAPASPVTVPQLNGTNLALSYKTPGPVGEVAVTINSTSALPSLFPSGSFNGSVTLGGAIIPSSLSSPYITLYSYDPLGNLLCVEQHGDNTTGTGCAAASSNDATSAWRVRRFTYNSLSQLLTATNPESGTISYTYDKNGNVLTKTAPAPNQTGTATVTITFAYDSINRLTQKSYSDGQTPAAHFLYDAASGWPITQPNLTGRLSESWVTTSAGRMLAGEIFGYDPMGRISANYQCSPVNCGSGNNGGNYTYDLAGEMTSAFNPVSGVAFQYNSAGHVTGVSENIVNANHPQWLVSTISHNAAGQAIATTYGNGLTETAAYNSRLQPCRINTNSSATTLVNCGAAAPTGNVLDLTYGYGVNGTNNGDVMAFTMAGQQTATRNYTYDSLDRVSTMSDTSASATCKGLSWTYDAWGNRTAQNTTSGSCLSPQTTATIKNQLGAPYQYDAAGNMIYDGTHHYYYDAENRQIQVDGTLGTCSTSTYCYTYDANGLLVQGYIPSFGTVDYVRDLDGNNIATWYVDCCFTGWGEAYIHRGGKLLAEYGSGTTYFAHTDLLGSTRLMTGVDKSMQECDDYYPFGERVSCGGSISSLKFTRQRP